MDRRRRYVWCTIGPLFAGLALACVAPVRPEGLPPPTAPVTIAIHNTCDHAVSVFVRAGSLRLHVADVPAHKHVAAALPGGLHGMTARIQVWIGAHQQFLTSRPSILLPGASYELLVIGEPAPEAALRAL